jgi:hypothetical protein
MDHPNRPPDGRALPSVGALSSAAMCPNLPAPEEGICPNLPPAAQSNPAECAQTCPGLPEPALGERANATSKTNPNATHSERPMSRPLSDKQLAAARWVVCGYGSKAIAQRLGVNHHTVGVWKQDPRFIALVAELRAKADASAVAFTAQRQVVAAGGSPQTGASKGSTSVNTNRRLSPPATMRSPDRTGTGTDSGSVSERLLARILERRGNL